MIVIVTLALCVLIVTGVKLIFNITARDIIDLGKKLFANDSSNASIRSRVKSTNGKKKQFLKNQVMSVIDLMKETSQENNVKSIAYQCIIFAVLGLAFAVLIKNYIAIPICVIGFTLIPVWRLKLYDIRYTKYIVSQLESCISLVTTSYIRNNDIVKAVEDNLKFIDPIIQPVFSEFLTEYKLNANMDSCIKSMQYKINNSVFSEWCISLMKAYHNNALKEDLILISSKLSFMREVQDDLDTDTSQTIFQYIIMLWLLVLTIPLIYVINHDWFMWLFTTSLGKVAIAYGLMTLFISINRLITLSKPVKFKR